MPHRPPHYRHSPPCSALGWPPAAPGASSPATYTPEPRCSSPSPASGEPPRLAAPHAWQVPGCGASPSQSLCPSPEADAIRLPQLLRVVRESAVVVSLPAVALLVLPESRNIFIRKFVIESNQSKSNRLHCGSHARYSSSCITPVLL